MKSIVTLLLLGALSSFPAKATQPTTPDSLTLQNADTLRTINLDGITVSASRSEIKVTADKITFTPTASISAAGTSLYHALNTMPGVKVETDGNISVNGQNGISVYIDGRKSMLSDDAMITYLKSTATSDCASIEIISKPSARTEATESTTYLSIRRRRNVNKGIITAITSDSHGWKALQFYESLFTGYSDRKNDLTLAYSNVVDRYPSQLVTDRPYPATEERLTQYYNRKRRDSIHNLRLTFDCRPDSQWAAGISLTGNMFRRKEPAEMTTYIPLSPRPSVTSNKATFITRNIYGGVYLKRTIPLSESDWTAAIDFFNYRSREHQLISHNRNNDLKGYMAGTTKGVIATLDRRQSVSPHWHLSAGIRCSYVRMQNNGDYDGTIPDSEAGDNIASTFGYTENVNAVYAEARAVFGCISAGMGIRGEYYRLHSHFSGNESFGPTDDTRHKTGIFPSASITIDRTGYSWSLTYGSRIVRPRFADLDPFIHIFDNITHVGGNITLRESRARTIGLTWSDGYRFRMNLSATQTDDDIVKIYQELTDRIVYVTPGNIPRHTMLSLSFSSSSIRLKEWWEVSAMLSVAYTDYSFSEQSGIPANSILTPIADVKNNFSLPYGLGVEISANFRGEAVYGQARLSPLCNTYIGLRKSWLNGMLSASLYLRDIFNTNHYDSTIFLSGRRATLREKEFDEMRIVGISLSLRHNSGHKKNIDSRNSWTEELNRINL